MKAHVFNVSAILSLGLLSLAGQLFGCAQKSAFVEDPQQLIAEGGSLKGESDAMQASCTGRFAETPECAALVAANNASTAADTGVPIEVAWTGAGSEPKIAANDSAATSGSVVVDVVEPDSVDGLPLEKHNGNEDYKGGEDDSKDKHNGDEGYHDHDDDDGSKAEPTPLPTIVPTIVPTVVPTALPTIAPTPTPVPTPYAGKAHMQTVMQPERGKVDVLWVIDPSGSMGWAQDELADKFANFANKLLEANIDFQLGVTSTDVCDSSGKLDEYCPDKGVLGSSHEAFKGTLVNVPSSTSKILNNNTAGLVNKFKAMAMLGTEGSSAEQGLSAAYFAAKKSASLDVNRGFLRSDANLAVIVLSDEEDDGIGFWEEYADGSKGNLDVFKTPSFPLVSKYSSKYNFANQKMTADKFVAEMNGIKGAGKFQVNAITGMRNSAGQTYCSKNRDGSIFGPQEAGTNYIKAATLTGGVAENICGNWENMLSNIGQSAVELTTRITLDVAPFPNTLEVSVDGNVWVSGWEYDSASRAITFKTLPPYGSRVDVGYLEIVTP